MPNGPPKLPKDIKKRKARPWVSMLIKVTITMSIGFSFGWYTTEYHITNRVIAVTDTLYVEAEPETVIVSHVYQPAATLDTVTVVHTIIDTVTVPKTITFYDTIAVHKRVTHIDTIYAGPPAPYTPPRPWGTRGRPD